MFTYVYSNVKISVNYRDINLVSFSRYYPIVSGDMKNTLMSYGLSAATANFPCVYCLMPKQDFAKGM